MASPWRIRHKLILGLVLVAGIVALLVVGTLKGLLPYHATMKTISSKLEELTAAEALKASLTDLAPPSSASDLNRQRLRIQTQLRDARAALDQYELRLQDTISRGRDPDNGFQEQQHVQALRELLDRLEKVVNQPSVPQMALASDDSFLDTYRTNVQEAIRAVVQTAADLRDAIYADLNKRISESRKSYLQSMWIVLTTSIVGIALMAGLLRFFYSWVFNPIRELQRGAGRVAQGNFEQMIEVNSGDEMQDLAAAFNHMTGKLRDMYRDLARQVNDRSRQLVRSERLASVGFLAAGVAHEINNPLASIAFCSEALESRLAEALPRTSGHTETVNKYLRMIQDEAFRCKKITERLLEFSRGGERRREPTDLAELILSVLEVARLLPNCKGKEIQFPQPGRLVAWVNSQEINQVVLNLVVNALDSMEEGGTLTIRLQAHEGMAEVAFTDTGCGMSTEVLENIFEPFYTRSRTGKGTGLGLTISHLIITQHHGELEASSAGVGQGSTFLVRLPLKPADDSPADRDPEIGRRAVEDENSGAALLRLARRAA